MSLSPQCSCLHEAGHAVAWVVNGDHLLLVIGYAGANLTPKQADVWNGAIGTNRATRSTVTPAAIRAPGGNNSCEHCKSNVLSSTCPTCVKTLTSLPRLSPCGRCRDSSPLAERARQKPVALRSRASKRPLAERRVHEQGATVLTQSSRANGGRANKARVKSYPEAWDRVASPRRSLGRGS